MKTSLLALGFLAVTGCSTTPDPPPNTDKPDADAPCSTQLELGKNTAQGFVPFENDQTVGVLLGFQGFRFIEGAARLTHANTEFAFFRFQITFKDHSPLVQDRAAMVTPLPDGTQLAENVQIFFNDIPMAELLEEYPRIDAAVTAGTCTGKQTLSVRLSDAGTCDDLTQGGSMFPDGGGPCADAGL